MDAPGSVQERRTPKGENGRTEHNELSRRSMRDNGPYWVLDKESDGRKHIVGNIAK